MSGCCLMCIHIHTSRCMLRSYPQSHMTHMYPPPHMTHIQVYVVLLSSVLMGGVFGCSFGLLDVENDSASHRRFDQVLLFGSLLGLFWVSPGSLMGLFWVSFAIKRSNVIHTIPQVISHCASFARCLFLLH